MANLSVLLTISVTAVFLFLTAQTVSGIMCYQCNSGRDPGCTDINENSTESSYYRMCEPILGQKKPFFCRTVTQTIKDRGNLLRIVRSCGWEKHPKKECYEFEDEDHQERVCQCFKDGCNSKASDILRPTVFGSLMCLLLLTLLHMR